MNLDAWLRKKRTNLPDLCDELGLPGGKNLRRTMEEVRQEVQAFFDEHGRRPSCHEMASTDRWLRVQGTALRKLCDEMGLPGGAVFGRTMEGARQEIQAFFEEHGRRPYEADLNGASLWLRKEGTSLQKLCDEMGLPKHRDSWSAERARQEVQAFFDEHGRRPLVKENTALGHWLTRRGTSLSKLCDEMGLPWPSRSKYTREKIRPKIQAFFDEHGRRPIDKEVNGISLWLRRVGATLRDVCNEMELPGGLVLDRTMEGARQEIQAFFEEHGTRPRVVDKKALASWLRGQGTNLRKLCDEMGLPKIIRARNASTEEVVNEATKEIQAFFDEHGRRPSVRERAALAATLRSRASSIPQICEAMGLPKRSRSKRTLEGARQEIQAFFEEHGRRPACAEMGGLSNWSATQGTTLRKLCDELELPGNRRYDRTIEGVRREIQAFFEEHGRRPKQKEGHFNTLDQWLFRHGSSIPKLCNEMGLPGGLVLDRTMEGARQEIQAFFDEHGRRPMAKELRPLNKWLLVQTPRSTVAKLCHEMGLP